MRFCLCCLHSVSALVSCSANDESVRVMLVFYGFPFEGGWSAFGAVVGCG